MLTEREKLGIKEEVMRKQPDASSAHNDASNFSRATSIVAGITNTHTWPQRFKDLSSRLQHLLPYASFPSSEFWGISVRVVVCLYVILRVSLSFFPEKNLVKKT